MKENNSKRRLSYSKRRRPLNQDAAADSTRADAVRDAARLFKSGYQLDLSGRHDSADAIYRHTIEVLEQLSGTGPSIVQVSNVAALAQNHGVELFKLGRYTEARLAFMRSRELLDSMVLLDASYGLIVSLADTLSWLARTQRKTGLGTESARTYERCIALWRTLMEFPQSGMEIEQMEYRLATALFGLSKVLQAHGQKRKAKRCRDEAFLISNGMLPR